MVTTQGELMTDEKLQKRYQGTTYGQILQICYDHRTKKITAKTLLQCASHFHRAVETTDNDNNDTI